jgi:hypothetical protein
MLYGAFFPIGVVAMLLGLTSNSFIAFNANAAFVLNVTLGTYQQYALPHTVACAVPYEGQALVALQNGKVATFALVDAMGNVKTLKGTVDGKVMSCSIYKDLLAVSYEEGGKTKVALYIVSEKGVTKSVELPAVKGADMVLVGPTYTAVYGESGLYVYKAGKPVKVCSKPVVKAKAQGDMGVLTLKTNAVVLMELPSGKPVLTITPKEGTVTDAMLVKADGVNSLVLVALKGTAKGLVLYKGKAEVMSVGLQNVCSITSNGKYVGAVVKDPNLGNGVAAVPLSWFTK